MYAEILSPYTPLTKRQSIKKDFFIQSRNEDIRQFYEFNPKPIGKGGFGVVFKALLKIPPYSNRVVKVIRKKNVKNIQALKKQVQFLRKVDHPHIVKLYESYEDETYLYLVLDFWQGGQLFDRIDSKGHFSQEEARQIFQQAVKTVKYLHVHKIAHRDIKAQNFMFSRQASNEIALIDFGLAYEWQYDMQYEMQQKGDNKVQGTSYYIAPEVIAKNYDEKCDIWSLGVLLFVITTASAPFTGENDLEILQNVQNMKMNTEQQFSQLSPLLQDLIRKILVKSDQRLTLDQILDHPWLKKEAKVKQTVIDYQHWKQFATYSKLKAITLNFIASQLPARQTQIISKQFMAIDSHNDGFLSVDQIQSALKRQQIKPNCNQLRFILKSIDMDKNGKINFNEFVASCLSGQLCHREDYLATVFRYFDKSNHGKITFADLQAQIGTLGLQLPNRIAKQIMKETDLDGDGEISYQEFVNSIKNKVQPTSQE